jgi:hypothetical protein
MIYEDAWKEFWFKKSFKTNDSTPGLHNESTDGSTHYRNSKVPV